MRRVCASRPGIALKIIMVTGTNTHCTASTIYFKRLFSFGRGGSIVREITEEMTRPNMATMRRSRTRIGRLYERTVW
jgi:hypothetical protein